MPTVIAIVTNSMLEGCTTDISAIGLVEIASIVLAEVVFEEPAVDLLDEGEETHVTIVDRQLRIGVA